MRITIKSTHSEPQYSSKAQVEVPYDDLTLEQLTELFAQAAVGYGFNCEDVRDSLLQVNY